MMADSLDVRDGLSAPIHAHAPIVGVVVYGRGAVITRRLMVEEELPETAVDLVLAGVTLLADPGTVRVRLPEAGRVLVGVNARISVPEVDDGPGPTAEKVEELTRRIDRLVERQSSLEARLQRLHEFMLAPKSRKAVKDEGPLARVESSLALSEVVADTIDSIDRRTVELRGQLERLRRERDAAQLEDRQTSSQDRMGTGEPTRTFELRLGPGQGTVSGAEISYAVPCAARWWPLYTLRLTDGGRRATLAMEALIAQTTGEDWQNVPVGLSTSELVFDANLPDLPALKLGKSQRLKRRGFREPPQGVDTLFEPYDSFRGKPKAQLQLRGQTAGSPGRNAPARRESPPLPPPQASPAPSSSHMELEAEEAVAVADEGVSEAPDAWLMMQSVPAVPKGRSLGIGWRSSGAPVQGFGGAGANIEAAPGGGGGLTADQPAASDNDPGDEWLQFDSLVLAGPDEPRRGQLRQREAPSVAGSSELHDAQASARKIGVIDPAVSRGLFDYRYDSAGAVGVPADGRLHRVSLHQAEAESRLVFRCVPVAEPAVYREARLENPFDSPLLDGPVDVFSEGQLVTTTRINRVDAGGSLQVGLGVDERLRVARNVRMVEESAGLLGGKRELRHEVEIELRSGLGFDSRIEVLDRIPVTNDHSVDVELLGSVPRAESYQQIELDAPVEGGLRWEVDLDAGGRTTIEYSYEITLKSKDELVGGNRRD